MGGSRDVDEAMMSYPHPKWLGEREAALAGRCANPAFDRPMRE
jgi:hypothetical protein